MVAAVGVALLVLIAVVNDVLISIEYRRLWPEE